ncbi:transposase family protein [Roseofilum casamattae]
MLEEQIILTLFYLHNFPMFQILGIQFGVSKEILSEMELLVDTSEQFNLR